MTQVEKVANQNWTLLVHDRCAGTCNTWRMCRTISVACVHHLRTHSNLLKTAKKNTDKPKTHKQKYFKIKEQLYL